jgi:hypothetical protein
MDLAYLGNSIAVEHALIWRVLAKLSAFGYGMPCPSPVEMIKCEMLGAALSTAIQEDSHHGEIQEDFGQEFV